MNYKPIRLLRADEINCRVQQVTDSNGAIILLYKDARVDMNILDETFTPTGWQREHADIDGGLFCTIKVWDDEKKEWVAKQDVGVESNTEAAKGEASDAFKRAGFNWGIGRELYTGPFIFVQLEQGEWQTGKNGKPQASFRFGLTVKEITYNENREIKTLVLMDKQGKERFSSGKGKFKPAPMIETPPEPVKEPVKITMTVTPTELAQRKKEVAALQKDYNISAEKLKEITDEMKCWKLNEMTAPEYADFLIGLQNRIS